MIYGNALKDEQTSSEQISALRAMTGLRRLHLAERIYWSASKIRAAELRHQHPDWPESRLNAAVRQIFSHART
jgi:DNA-binding transcriptional regulator YiaG